MSHFDLDTGVTVGSSGCLPLARAAEKKQIRLEALGEGGYPGRLLPQGAMLGLTSVGFWDAEIDQTWSLDWHCHEGLEISFFESGALQFSTGAGEARLGPDYMTVVKPWQLHRLGTPQVTASRVSWFIIDLNVRQPNDNWMWPSWLPLTNTDIVNLTNTLRNGERAMWKSSPEMRRCFQTISRSVAADREGSHVSRLRLAISDVLLRLLEMLSADSVHLDERRARKRQTVKLFLEYLAQNPENFLRRWSLEAMAGSCGLGVTQFVHHVRCITNRSPLQYLNACRLDAAKRILRESPRVSVTDIAFEAGFSSTQYFATQFRRRFGLTPREFRNNSGRSPNHI